MRRSGATLVLCAVLIAGCSDGRQAASSPSCHHAPCTDKDAASTSPSPDAAAHPDASFKTFAPEKGPAHAQALPALDDSVRFLDGDDTWRYVAPSNPGHLYDAAYFDGQWWVLHGLIENDQKARVSEINWLSSSPDGVSWKTRTLTEQAFESYTQLASNGKSLLLAGTRHVALVDGDEVVPIPQLEQQTAPPVLIALPDGYVLGRRDDVVFMDLDGSIDTVFAQDLAQFSAGALGDDEMILVGPFTALSSKDGRAWRTLPQPPCNGCGVVTLAHGKDTFLAADPETLFTSPDARQWKSRVWERAVPVDGGALDEAGEDKIGLLDFTGGYFELLTWGGNTSLSRDGSTWTNQLKIPLGQIGPAACGKRCLIANGRILLPPIFLNDPPAPAGADPSSPYYCEYLQPVPDGCSSCGGATIDDCHEGVFCARACNTDADCPVPSSGHPAISCNATQAGKRCFLGCDAGQTCPAGMTCDGVWCLYVFDNPRCQ